MTEKVEDLLKKAKELTQKHEFKEALEILEKLSRNNPDSSQVKKNLIDTLLNYGGYLNDEYVLKYKEAEKIFKKVIEIDPTNYRAHYNLGIVNYNLDDIEKAKLCYEEAIRIKPDYKHCLYNLGLAYEKEGDLMEALQYYEKALEIDPKFPYAFNARNQILANLHELKKSKRSKNIGKLKSLLEISKRIKIDMIQAILNLNDDNMVELLIDWGKKYQFEVDGEFLIINKETLSDLINDLEFFDIEE
ncbi:MAG: tetratricopeptide repeat protein [Promethearchaeota archaeon]